MYGKAEVESVTEKHVYDEKRDRIEVTESNCGKIVIQVNLSKESLYTPEISQLIREIFLLRNRSVEAEKVEVQMGEDSWKTEMVDMPLPSLPDKKRKASGMKLVRYNKPYRLPKRQAKPVPRRKLSEKLSDQFEPGQLDVSEVHSSPAITNLLSQLYPNPYNLISLLDVKTGRKDTVDASDSCKIRFKAKEGLRKESDVEQEFAVFSVPKIEIGMGEKTEKKLLKKNSTEKVKNGSQLETDISKFSGVNQPENDERRTVKRKIIASAETQTGTDSNTLHEGSVWRNLDVTVDNRKRFRTTESKVTKKKVLKTENPTPDRSKRNVKVPSTGEKVSISTIHPMSLHKTNLTTEEKPEKKPTNDTNPKSVLEPMTAKKKCVMKYLKLIKDLYEAEERCLQSKIDDAWNFAVDQMETPKTRKLQQTGQNGKLKHSQSQTPKPRKGSIAEVQQKRPEPIAVKENSEFTPRKNERFPEQKSLLLRSSHKPEPSCSWLNNHQQNSHRGLYVSEFGVSTKKPSTIRMDTFVFRRKIPKNADGFPIEIINRNVLETNRKIDLLIRHIDNSMDWLSQSERAPPSNISSLIQRAKDLSEKLQENLKPGLLTRRNRNLSYNRSDMPLSPSYQSLHFFPVEGGKGRVRIQTGTFFSNRGLTRDCLWFSPDIVGNRGVSCLTSDRRIENLSRRCSENGQIGSEVPELLTDTEPMLILVEDRNELGSFTEEVYRRSQPPNSVALNDGSDLYRLDSLCVSVIALDDSSSAVRPVVMQEITWSFPVPAPSPVTRMHYRNERHMVFTTMEANVLHVSRATTFMDLALMSVAQVVEQELKQQSSVIISLHKCSSFVKYNDGADESGSVSKFEVLPTDEKTRDEEVSRKDIKVLKGAQKGGSDWDPFHSESSVEMYNGNKLSKTEAALGRCINMNSFGTNLTWLPDPYESNPADEGTEPSVMKQKKFHAITSGPQGSSHRELFPDDWVTRKMKLDGSPPPIFRYLSSETSNTSLDEKEGNALDHTRKASMFSSINNPAFPDKTGDNTVANQQEEKHEDDDSSSTSSFKSSNDFSDVNELPELNYPKKRPKSRSHFLDKLFHELRTFRKCLTRRRGPKRKNAHDEFEDALSELSVDIQQEDKALVEGEKQTVDEAVAVSTICIDKLGSHTVPRKIFKTSFRGKESVTDLMIDLKDVSISEVRDISVEKRKLSTDHTKISIIISKQGENAICCANQNFRKGDKNPSREGSHHSITDAENTNCLGWKKDGTKSEDDDDDYKSAHSGCQTRSLEDIPSGNVKEDRADTDFGIRDTPRRSKTVGRHKFDFYKKMEDATSFDSLKLDGNELLFGKYDKDIAPLKKALADIQFRVHNIQKNTFCTSDEYYERALKLAKMSAGYCRSCKTKTIIPEDPLGIYQKLIPRTSLRNPYNKHRKYYFKTTSSTNSSFYSIHSSNSDASDKFCHLNSSSSIIANGLTRSRGSVLRESTDCNIPLFLGRTFHF